MKVVGVVLFLLTCPGGVLLGWGQQRNQSGVRIGTVNRQVVATGTTNIRKGSDIKIGGVVKGLRNYTKPTTTTPFPVATQPPMPPPTAHHPPPPYSQKGRLPVLNVSIIVDQYNSATALSLSIYI